MTEREKTEAAVANGKWNGGRQVEKGRWEKSARYRYKYINTKEYGEDINTKKKNKKRGQGERKWNESEAKDTRRDIRGWWCNVNGEQVYLSVFNRELSSRDLDKYYCQHLIILLGSSDRNCNIKSIQKKGRKRARGRRAKRRTIYARKKKKAKKQERMGRTKYRNRAREREKRKRVSLIAISSK